MPQQTENFWISKNFPVDTNNSTGWAKGWFLCELSIAVDPKGISCPKMNLAWTSTTPSFLSSSHSAESKDVKSFMCEGENLKHA